MARRTGPVVGPLGLALGAWLALADPYLLALAWLACVERRPGAMGARRGATVVGTRSALDVAGR